MSGGKIIAFSGPPGCGKTVLSVRTAAELAGTGKRTVLISLDNTVPSVPLIFPRLGHGDLKSIGGFLMSLDVDSDSLLRSAITVRNNPNLIFLGYMPGENILTYPEFSPARTVRLYESALSVADYVIVDTKSGFREDVLSDCAVSRADLRADIYNPDIRTTAYYTSAAPLYPGGDEKKVIRVLNRNRNDVFFPEDEMREYMKKADAELPYSRELAKNLSEGTLVSCGGGPKFDRAIKKLVTRITTAEVSG